jgi:WD40 repeat protein
MAHGVLSKALDKSNDSVTALAWSQDNRSLAIADEEGNLWFMKRKGGSNSSQLGRFSKSNKFKGHKRDINSLAFSPDGSRLVSAGDDRVALLWSVDNVMILNRFVGHEKGINSVQFTPDGKHVVTASDDKTVRFWRANSGTEVARQISMRDGWAVVAPDGRFDGTLDGDTEDRLSAIQWSVDNTNFSVDGFMEQYYRPALLGRILSKNRKERYKAARVMSAPNISEGFLRPPKVAISVPSSSRNRSVAVKVDVEDMGGGIDEVRLYHNGKIVDPSRGYNSGSSKGSSGIIEKKRFNVDLVDGENQFKAVALSKDRIESEAETGTTRYTASSRGSQINSPTIHLLVVGVNKYKDKSLNLDYAVPDAKGMLRFFKKVYANSFGNIRTKEVYNEKATRANITRELENLSTLQPEDTLVLYFAGHGDTVKDSWYFVPHEQNGKDAKALDSQGVSAELFKDLISKIGAHKVVLLFDSCKSGAAINAFSEFENKRSMSELSRATGIHIATATTQKQSASELAELGHGVFTYALLQGLKGRADKKPKDTKVSTAEIFDFIKRYIPFLTYKYNAGAQNPVINSRGDNFVVAGSKK